MKFISFEYINFRYITKISLIFINSEESGQSQPKILMESNRKYKVIDFSKTSYQLIRYCQEYVPNMCKTYLPTNRAPNSMKQKVTELKGGIENSTIIFNSWIIQFPTFYNRQKNQAEGQQRNRKLIDN